MGSNVAFDGHREELTGGLGVADRTPVAHAEHRGEVQRVGAVDERLLELAIHAEAVWAARPAEMLLHEAAAGDRCHSIRGLLGDEHVGLEVLGQRSRRCARKFSNACLVRSSSGRVRPPMVKRRSPKATSSRRSLRMADGRAAWTAASTSTRRCSAVVAALTTASISWTEAAPSLPGCAGRPGRPGWDHERSCRVAGSHGRETVVP